MTVSNSCKFVHISDLHLNHTKVSTLILVMNLYKWLTKNVFDVDYLFITGDVFDHPTVMDSTNGKAITRCITMILSFCVKRGIKLRVLKGTSNHDGKQSEHFVTINDGLESPADLMYLDDITVWREGELTFLSVPDNMAGTCAKVQAKVEEVLRREGIEQVDIALTHGMYDSHLLGAGFKQDTHSYEYYASITRIIILNGHIHTGGLYGKLLTAGSFDRNRHGEEERKGGYIGEIRYESKDFQITFTENENAFPFLTYKIGDEDSIADAYNNLVDYIKEQDLLDNAYLRLEYRKGFGYGELTQRLTSKFGEWPEFSPKQRDGVEEVKATTRVVELDEIKTIPLTKATLPELIKDKLVRLGVEDTKDALQALEALL